MDATFTFADCSLSYAVCVHIFHIVFQHVCYVTNWHCLRSAGEWARFKCKSKRNKQKTTHRYRYFYMYG